MLEIKCKHCNINFDSKIMIKEKEFYFCCKGCLGVFNLLTNENLDSFYDKVGNKSLSAVKAHNNEDLKSFDEKSFYENYVNKTSDDFSSINLIIEGIHCAACIWLNEKILNELDGIIEVNINFTNNKAKIIFDEEEIKLSLIIKKIRSIGYNAYAYDSSIAEEKSSKAKKDYFIKMMIAVFSSVNIMMLSVAKYTGFFTGIQDEIKDMIHLAEFLLATTVLFYSGSIFFKGAFYALKNRMLNMDFLVCLGASLSYLYSIFILFGFKGESYFDSVTMIITFVLVGKYLEVIGKKSAVDTIDKIKSKLPLSATIIKDSKKETININSIQVGDILELEVGQKASVDGVLLNYESTFDESSISGESKPVYKKESDLIYSSSINTQNILRYKASKTFKDSTLNTIVTLLEDSLNHKPLIEQKANEFSKVFTFAVLSLSIITFFVWYFLGLDFGFSYGDTTVFEKSFIVAISVIVIACPCALALATPMASLIGISTLAKKGLLFKESRFLETVAKVDTVVFDKTGTLTKGELSVNKMEVFTKDKELINLLFSILSCSSHPISKAVLKHIKQNFTNLSLLDLNDIKTIQAKGLSALYTSSTNQKYEIVAGNEIICKDNNINVDFEINDSIYIFAVNKKIEAVFSLEDEIKNDAKELISYLKEQNINIIMLSGDNENVVKKTANKLEILSYEFNTSPKDKANYINTLKKEKKIILFAGDGLNDSIALSCSHVGVSMGSGTDTAISVSDIILLDNSLDSLKQTFVISKRVYKFIKQNLLISFVYNLITIPLAVFGLVIPLVAALSMSLSSLLVVLNSLRIKNKE